MLLSDLTIRKLTPKKKRYEVPDGGGLSIRVLPGGKKSWQFGYRFNGVQRRMTLGAYPAIGLADARKKHAQAVSDLENGVDPGKEAVEKKQKLKKAPTFEDLLEEFWKMELCKTASGSERLRLVRKDALKPWRRKAVADIKRRDAVLLLDRVRTRAPITANRLQSVLVRMMNFGAERGLIDHSPLTGLRRPQEKPRSRFLTDAEIRLLWTALDLKNKEIDIYHVTKLALKLILITAQRPGEVAGMAWSEIDDEGPFWNIPPSRMKNSEPQRVPLCPMALDVIEQARPYSSDCAYVFQSSHKPGEPIMRAAMTKAVRRHWSEMEIKEKFTPHDLRRTTRTKLAELGVSDIVAERVLGHKLQGMMAVYNRHSYDVEKRQALMLWEQRLQEIIGLSAPSKNVIRFAPRSA